jgi:[ribosomal protein S18]-alanine N-acetyltransferase
MSITLPLEILVSRPMLIEDVPEVFDIEVRSYEFPWSEKILLDCIEAGYLCNVAYLGDFLAAYGIMSFGAGEAHILNLCVDTRHRRQGIGKQLITTFLEKTRAQNVSNVYLEVRPSNIAAIELYYKVGFSKIGERPNYYPALCGREDAYVLNLSI